ncbi:aldo/keto reductase [Bradyrhizobium cajani]|uniref:Aldo/keto reductase n=1 Tax=Bradyrhizobium cajani TaxID=1928661 RepID=A0A844TBA5_9BRAD|nr:aldo/keto reductase [Bradyrhizobium cajani]MCP3369501.1 aldo/keto reductase [Bradyrhizobium cajani]MVT71910.1 aldo/keto reductase [Bradyrhizobium cajani]
MKTVCVEALGACVSSIGFGCASLGGRVGARAGLEALERAYDSGINWYDVAPSYGDGMAESICGQFASARRGSVYICTKIGMRPSTTAAAMRVLKPIARASLALFPGIQPRLSTMKPKPFKVPLSAELIRTGIESSLRRLRTDYVDVLALHRPTREEIVREDIIRAVERIVQDGKARAISIAGNNQVGIDGLDQSLPFRLLQIANNPLEPNVLRSRQAERGRTFVTYGTFSNVDELVARIGARQRVLNDLHELGYRGDLSEIAIAFVVDYALASNSAGVTLFSMFRKKHLAFNLLRLAQAPAFHPLNRIASELSGEQTQRIIGGSSGRLFERC